MNKRRTKVDEVSAKGREKIRSTCAALLLAAFGALIETWSPACAQLTCTNAQITNTTEGFNAFPSINSDGTRISFDSNADLTGENPDLNRELFLFDKTTGAFTQITKTMREERGSIGSSINADGTRIAFASANDLTGENPELNEEIFLFDTTSGTFTQITKTPSGQGGGSVTPSINADGTRIVFTSVDNLTGENPDRNQETFLFDVAAGKFTQITGTTGRPNAIYDSIDSAGTLIAFSLDLDLTGENPDLNSEIFLFDTNIGKFTQITKTTEGDSFSASINSDGTRIAFESSADLTGQNAEHNGELFLFDARANQFIQVTNPTRAKHVSSFLDPSINSDGTRIVFQSASDLIGENADLNLELFLFGTTSEALTQITSTTGGSNTDPSINSDGTRIAFTSRANPTGGNADGNSEIFLASCEVPAVGGILALDQTAGTGGLGALFRVNASTGARKIISDFGNSAQGPLGDDPIGLAIDAFGNALITDFDASLTNFGSGSLFSVDLSTGARSLISDLGNAAQGPPPLGNNPNGLAIEVSGNVLVTDSAAPSFRGALFRVDPSTGARALLSDFGDPAQGPLGVEPNGVALEASENILVIDSEAGSGNDPPGFSLGALFRVNPSTGARTLLSDFGDPFQGPMGNDPRDVAVEPSGTILIIDFEASPTNFGSGALFRVNPSTGTRTLLSDFGNPAQGPLGNDPRGVAIDASGNILVTDSFARLDGKGVLFKVNPSTGQREVISDFGNSTQGPLGDDPVGVAVVPGPRPLIACAGHSATIVGTEGDNVLIGTAGRDIIHGLRGNDVIRGLRGNDTVCGGRGGDRLHGGRGNDWLFGQRGNDRLFGQRGNDALIGGAGIDLCNGGRGRNSAARCGQIFNAP